MGGAAALSEAVEYRRIRVDDAASYARLFAEREVYAGTLQLPLPSEEAVRAQLETNRASAAAQIHLVALGRGEVIGTAGLQPRGPSLRVRHAMGLFIGVSQAWWGRGIGSELMRLLLDWADNWAGVLRIELGVYTDNERAIALYRKFGFAEEGVQRAYALRDGQYVDSMMMARLHPRPPQLPQRSAQ